MEKTQSGRKNRGQILTPEQERVIEGARKFQEEVGKITERRPETTFTRGTIDPPTKK